MSWYLDVLRKYATFSGRARRPIGFPAPSARTRVGRTPCRPAHPLCR
jgi:hypothetical protein